MRSPFLAWVPATNTRKEKSMIEESRDKIGGSPDDMRPGLLPRPMTRVLLADADGERRHRLRELLEKSDQAYLLVVAEASTEDPRSVLRRVRSLRPEAVAIGLGCGDASIVEVARELKDLPEPPKVVLFGEWDGGGPAFAGEKRSLVLVLSLADAHVPTSQLKEALVPALAGAPTRSITT